VEEVKKSRGLGLVSMQERVHLVHGKFHIESRSGMGTRIIAGVPVSPASAASSAEQMAIEAANAGAG